MELGRVRMIEQARAVGPTFLSPLLEDPRTDLSGTELGFLYFTERTRGKVGRANFPSSCVHPGASRRAKLTKEKSVL